MACPFHSQISSGVLYKSLSAQSIHKTHSALRLKLSYALPDIFNNGLKFTKQLNKNMKGIQVVVTQSMSAKPHVKHFPVSPLYGILVRGRCPVSLL